jgi:hypothetical protein
VAALLIPWSNYLRNLDLRPLFIFDDANPSVALLLALFTLGYLWRDKVQHLLVRRQKPVTVQPYSVNS